MITIGTSTYLILYSHQIYDRINPWLRIFERRNPDQEARHHEELETHDVIVFGLGRYGTGIARGLQEDGVNVLGIDFDPQVIRARQMDGIDTLFGEADDPELLGELPLSHARMVVCSVPSVDINLTMLRGLRQYGFNGKIIVTSHHQADSERLEAAGADRVLRPYVDASVRASRVIAEELQAVATVD